MFEKPCCFRLLQPRHEDDPVGRDHPVWLVQTTVAVGSQAPCQAGDRTPDVHDRVVPMRLLSDPAMALRPQSLGHVHVRRGQGHIQGAWCHLTYFFGALPKNKNQLTTFFVMSAI